MPHNSPKIYHKRHPVRTIISILVIVAVICLILALTAFIGFRHYIAYTDTGRLYLDIPWLEGYMSDSPTDDPLSEELTATQGTVKSNIIKVPVNNISVSDRLQPSHS